MEHTEQEIPFTDADRIKMREELSQAKITALIFGITLLAAVVAFVVVDSWYAFFAPPLFLAVLGYQYYNYSRDMARGTKLRVLGEITDKLEQNTISADSNKTEHYLTIGKYKVEVEYPIYTRFKIGEQVMFDFTYRSKKLLEAVSLSQPNYQKQVADSNPIAALLQQGEYAKSEESKEKLAEAKAVKKIVPLMPEDAKTIRTAKTKYVREFIFLLLFIIAFGAACIVEFLPGFDPNSSYSYATGFLLYGILIMVVLAFAKWQHSRLKPFNKDLDEKEKQVILTTIYDKFKTSNALTDNEEQSMVFNKRRSEGGYYYYVKYAGNPYPISQANYERFETLPQVVEIHLALHSKVVFKVIPVIPVAI